MSIAARMRRLQDEDLVQIANSEDADGFESDAIAAARAELQRRGLGEEAVGALHAQGEQRAAHEEAQKDAPLSWPARIAFMLFGFTLIGLFFAVAQRHLGYPRKSADAFRWTLFGLGFWALVAVLFAVTDAIS